MNEQEVMEIAKAAYMSGESDKFIKYSENNKNFIFKDIRNESDLNFAFIYRNWSLSYDADDYWCDMCAKFDEIDSDLIELLGHNNLLDIVESIVSLTDPINDNVFLKVSEINFNSEYYDDAYANFSYNLDVYIFSLVGRFSDPQIAIMDGLIEKTSKTLARLYGHMGYRYELEEAAAA
jgi:hypothetical protein